MTQALPRPVDDDIDLALDDPESVRPVYLHPVARRLAALSFGAAIGTILAGIGYAVFGDGNVPVVALAAILVAVAFALFGLAAEVYATKDDRDHLVGEYVDLEV